MRTKWMMPYNVISLKDYKMRNMCLLYLLEFLVFCADFINFQ